MNELGAVEEFDSFNNLVDNEPIVDILEDLLTEFNLEVTRWHYGDRLP